MQIFVLFYLFLLILYFQLSGRNCNRWYYFIVLVISSLEFFLFTVRRSSLIFYLPIYWHREFCDYRSRTCVPTSRPRQQQRPQQTQPLYVVFHQRSSTKPPSPPPAFVCCRSLDSWAGECCLRLHGRQHLRVASAATAASSAASPTQGQRTGPGSSRGADIHPCK